MNETIQILKNQKTTRRDNFSSKTISDENIKIIKDSILKTANASNRQSYSVIELDKENASYLGFPGDSVFLFCIDFFRLKQLALKLNKEFDSQYLMQFTTALIDIGLLAQATVLASQSLGIDTLITNDVLHNKIEKIFNHLNIPESYVFPTIAVCLGYSIEKDDIPHGRLNPDKVFHKNKYQYSSERDLEMIINEYDDKVKKLGLIDNWGDKGFNHYLEWLFDKWFPVIGSRKQNDEFVRKLKETKIL
ncbi:MAG: hypothetical protein GY756_18390 [bacterium]|nr:hypothetical protein [bacterium]